MKTPRFSIAGLMVVVVFVALDFGIGRAIVGPPRMFPMPATELIILGVFPMANVLGIGLVSLVATRRAPGPGRPGLVGFVRFGLAAWLAFLACSILAPVETNEAFRGPIMASGLPHGPPLASFAAVVFALPQLALAGLGGWITGRHVIQWSIAVERPDGVTILQLGGPRPARPGRSRGDGPAGHPGPP